jgi:hypothetical protein
MLIILSWLRLSDPDRILRKEPRQKDKIYDWEMFVYVLFKNVFNLFRTVKFENDAEISVGGLNDDALLFNTYLLPNQSASQ